MLFQFVRWRYTECSKTAVNLSANACVPIQMHPSPLCVCCLSVTFVSIKFVRTILNFHKPLGGIAAGKDELIRF